MGNLDYVSAPGEVRQYVATSFCQCCHFFGVFSVFFFFLVFFSKFPTAVSPFPFFSFCDCSHTRQGHTLPQTVYGKVYGFFVFFGFISCLCTLLCLFCPRVVGCANLNWRLPLFLRSVCAFSVRVSSFFCCVKVGLSCPVSALRRWRPARRPSHLTESPSQQRADFTRVSCDVSWSALHHARP